MFVEARHGEPREIEPLSALEHRIHQLVHLGAIEPAEIDGHEESGHLVVGYFALGVGENQLAELTRLEPLAIAFAFNKTGYDHLGSAGVFSSWKSSHRHWSSYARSWIFLGFNAA